MKSNANLSAGSNSHHKWTLMLAPGPAPSAIEELEELINTFANSMRLGAFIQPNARQAPSGELLEGVKVQGTLVSFEYLLNQCDERYARVLRNNLFAFSEITHMIDSLEVTQEPKTPHTIYLEVNASEVANHRFYPSRLEHYPFKLKLEDPMREDRNRIVIIEYGKTIDDKICTMLDTIVETWAHIVFFGYPDSEATLSAGNFGVVGSVEGAIADDATYEIAVDIFVSAAAAWTPLFNMLACLDPELRPIKLTLD